MSHSRASTIVLDRSDCVHSRTRVELLPREHKHYARVVCGDCGKQLCYRANPTNAQRRRQNAAHIQELLSSSGLTEWERGYCEGLHHNHRPTPNQQSLLDQLVTKHLNRKVVQIEHSRKTNGSVCYDQAVTT
jgi:hypothetical protein